MPTIPIVPQTTAPVPFAVVELQTLEAELLCAYAEWDGSGASGDFLPCLAIYSDARIRLGRVFPGATVAAGDSAVVTYAPFPGGIASDSSPAVLLEEVASDTVTLPGVPAGAGTQVAWTPVGLTPIWDHTAPTNPRSKVAGLLVVTANVEVHSATPMTPGALLFSQILIPGPIGVFPGVMNAFGILEATAAIPAPATQTAAAGLILTGQRAVLVINNGDVNPVDITYIIRSNVVEV